MSDIKDVLFLRKFSKYGLDTKKESDIISIYGHVVVAVTSFYLNRGPSPLVSNVKGVRHNWR